MHDINISTPSYEEYKKHMKETYKNSLTNQNSMSYWYPKIKEIFKTPDTIIIPIDFDKFLWLSSDNYKSEEINKFDNWLKEEIKKSDFNTNRELFIKTGNFSHKFYFPHCHIVDYVNENIGEHALNVFYMGMCVGCETSHEFAFREFIKTKEERNYIYNGMKLNTEFRIFYDFDNKQIQGIFNYWDRETMTNNLKDNDLIEYNKSVDLLENEFMNKKGKLEKYIEDKLSKVELKGDWSVDFLCDGEDFWLIDMALAKQSYYYNKIQH